MTATPLTTHLLKVIPEFMGLVRREIKAGGVKELTLGQFRVLAHLSSGILSNSELADQVGIDVTVMSRTVDVLVKRGLLKRAPGEKDRRKVRLSLTPSGRAKFLKIVRGLEASIDRLIQQLSETERQSLRTGLDVMAKLSQLADESERRPLGVPRPRPPANRKKNGSPFTASATGPH